MKHIVFSVAVFCAVVAQAGYYKYDWQPTDGGELSKDARPEAWTNGGTTSASCDEYRIDKAQTAPLTLAGDWTLPGSFHVRYKPNVFNFGTSTLTVQNGITVDFGAKLTISNSTKVVCTAGSYLGQTQGPDNKVEILSGSDVAFRSVYIGSNTASSNTLVVVDNAKMSIDEPSDSHKAYLYLGGQKTAYSCGNTLVITNGGKVTSPSIRHAYIGYRGADNRLIVTGEDSTFEWGSGSEANVYVGYYESKTSWDGVPLGTNTLLITDHAQATLSNIYVGNSDTDVPLGGLENRLEVSGQAQVEIGGACSICPGGTLYATNATVKVAGVPKIYTGSRAVFVNSVVSMGGSGDFGNKYYHSGAEFCLTNSTLTVDQKLLLGSTNFVFRLHNSTAAMNELRTTFSGGKSSPGCTIVFSGAAPKMELPYLSWYAPSKLRFEISKAGFPTDRSVVTTSKAFYLEGDGTRTVEIAIDPKCPSGTYTLLKGTNAKSDKITISLDYNPDKTKAEIVRTTVDDVEALQVKVERIMKGLAVIVK